MSKIFLLGYMGCGKSTIARNLAASAQLPFVDLDQYIEDKSALSIKAIFEQYGEIKFRKMEHEALLELIAMPEPLIIALGGGTPCYANNHELFLRNDVISIYLSASIDTLFNRLAMNKSKRPIVADKSDKELKEFIAIHLFERSFFYNQASHTIRVDESSVDDIVKEIITLLA
jgi:shikimate kinase